MRRINSVQTQINTTTEIEVVENIYIRKGYVTNQRELELLI